MMNRIIELCNIIKSHTCKTCGGDFDKDTCIYCHSKDDELLNLENKLSNILNNITETNIELLIALDSISSFNIDKVNDILKQTNFKTLLNEKHNELLNKKDNYTHEDYLFMLHFVNMDLYNNIQLLHILMKELITNKLSLSNNYKIQLLKNFVDQIIIYSTGFRPHVTINDRHKNDNAAGSSISNYINLNENYLIELLNEKNYIEILDTIFHECTHTIQDIKIKYPTFYSYQLLLQSKEQLLQVITNNTYYKENYHFVSYEIEARYNGILQTYIYLESLGISLNNDDYSRLNNNIQIEKNNITKENRVFNGSVSNVNDIFDSIIDTIPINYFSRFPILGLQYKVVNGKIVKKTKQELDNDYSVLSTCLDSNPDNKKIRQEELDNLYLYLNNSLIKKSINQI